MAFLKWYLGLQIFIGENLLTRPAGTQKIRLSPLNHWNLMPFWVPKRGFDKTLSEKSPSPPLIDKNKIQYTEWKVILYDVILDEKIMFST